MSYPTATASFHPHPSSARSSARLPPLSGPSYASAYRAIHGPRLSLPYQSSYQRDYAAVDEYLRIKREKERERHRTERGEVEEDRAREEGEEETELKYGSDLDAEELGGEDVELVEEMKASSTFLPTPASPQSPPSPSPGPVTRHYRPASSSASSFSSSSSPSSPVSSSSPPRSLNASHSQHQPRPSVPSLPIHAWSHPPTDPLDDVSHSLHSSSLSSSTSSTPPTYPPSPAGLRRQLIGDRDSDWRPSRRRVPPPGYITDPITGRYTALSSSASSAVPSAASSMASSAFASRGSTPRTSEPSSPVSVRGRKVKGRLDPAAMPFAAGVPSQRSSASSSGVSTPALEERGLGQRAAGQVYPLGEASVERRKGRASVPSYQTYIKEEEEGKERTRGKKAGEWNDRTHHHNDSSHSFTPQHEVEEEERTAEPRHRREEEGRQSSPLADERPPHRHHRHHHHREGATRSHNNSSPPIPSDPIPPPIRSAVRGPPTQDPARLIEAVQAKRDRDRLLSQPLPPPSSISLLPLPLPSSSLTHPYTRTALHALSEDPFDPAYGYDGLTPGSIERRKEAERLEYEAELKRIREDPTNRQTRLALKERMNRWRNVV